MMLRTRSAGCCGGTGKVARRDCHEGDFCVDRKPNGRDAPAGSFPGRAGKLAQEYVHASGRKCRRS